MNYGKIINYYEHDCLKKFLLHFVSLLTALILKNCHILAGVHCIFIKQCPRSNLKGFQYQIWTPVKRSAK